MSRESSSSRRSMAAAESTGPATIHGVDLTLCDVGPRDGLQNDPTQLAPAVRAELCRRVAAAGVPRVEEGAAIAAEVIATGHAAGARVTATLSVAFGCPFEGRVDPGVVVEHVRRMGAAGADEVMLADTIGVGVPAQVRRLLGHALAATGGAPGRP